MPVTNSQVSEALAHLSALPQAPALQTYVPPFAAELNAQKISLVELRLGVRRAYQRETYFPPPAKLLNHIGEAKREAYAAKQRERQERDLAQAREQRALPAASDETSDKYAIPEGYPQREGPPRTPRPADETPTGPVLREDGTPDPYWPELPEREAAWRRKMLYDHDLCSWEYASALDLDRAKRAVNRMRVSGERGGGPKRLL